MIVCSCNVVTSQEIDAAVEEIVANDGDAMLTPGKVYRAIGVRPKCGTCLRHVAELIHAHRENLQGAEYARSNVDKAAETV